MGKSVIFTDSIFTTTLDNTYIKEHINYLFQKELQKNNLDNKSNVGGRQTKNIIDKKYVDFFTKPVIEGLRSFNVKDCKMDFYYGWINENVKNSYNNIHTHGRSHFSGVYYVKVPKDSGNLIFRRNDNTVEMQCYDEFFQGTDSNILTTITPYEGLFVLFPSHMLHFVSINNNDETRISTSFNIGLIKNG